MEKKYLLTPGPTPIPEEVMKEMARPIIHHRTPDYREFTRTVNESLKKLFKTKNNVYTFTASGTGAMEASVVNTLSVGDTAIVVRGGKFGERFTEICEAYGAKPVNIDIVGDVDHAGHECQAVVQKPLAPIQIRQGPADVGKGHGRQPGVSGFKPQILGRDIGSQAVAAFHLVHERARISRVSADKGPVPVRPEHAAGRRVLPRAATSALDEGIVIEPKAESMFFFDLLLETKIFIREIWPD